MEKKERRNHSLLFFFIFIFQKRNMVIEVRLHFYLFCNNMKRLRTGHKFSSPSFLVTMAFTKPRHICLSFKSYIYMVYLSMMATHFHPILFKFKELCPHVSVLWFILKNCFFGEQNFMLILHEKYDFNTYKDFLWKSILNLPKFEKQIQIANFLQQVLACSQSI
jgi:hypothetical protein